MTGVPTNLRIVGYNKSRVNLEWGHLVVGYHVPSFAYVVTVFPLGSCLQTRAFALEENPSISTNLKVRQYKLQ